MTYFYFYIITVIYSLICPKAVLSMFEDLGFINRFRIRLDSLARFDFKVYLIFCILETQTLAILIKYSSILLFISFIFYANCLPK